MGSLFPLSYTWAITYLEKTPKLLHNNSRFLLIFRNNPSPRHIPVGFLLRGKSVSCHSTHTHIYTHDPDTSSWHHQKQVNILLHSPLSRVGKDSCYPWKLGNTKKWEWIFEISLRLSDSNRPKFSIKMAFMKFTLSSLNQIPCIATNYKQICTDKNMADLQVKLQNWRTIKFCLAVMHLLLRHWPCKCSFSSDHIWYENPSENFLQK